MMQYKDLTYLLWNSQYTESGCLEWQKGCFPSGYGTVKHGGKQWRVHRLVWTLINGEIPDGKVIMHSCDNPKCCNPEHLSVGSPKDNKSDCVSKGRHAHGHKQGLSKLSADDVRAARKSKMTTQELAKRHGVDWSTMDHARRGLTWKHV